MGDGAPGGVPTDGEGGYSKVDGFDAAWDVVSRLPTAVTGPMLRLRDSLPNTLEATWPQPRAFAIHGDGSDVGVAVEMSVVRTDDRAVTWVVEAWLYATGPHTWALNVKAEIDLDDEEGEDYCVLNEQAVVDDLADVPGAVATAIQLVVGYPFADLLTPGWEPDDWREGETGEE